MNTKVPGLEVQYRVGGDVEMLKRLLAAGFPVMIEETFMMDESYWPNDDRWAGHYLLVTGYDDTSRQFTGQDVYVGPNLSISYDSLNDHWKAFNRVYILVYPPESRLVVQSILGEQWDVQKNRQHALDAARQEAEANPKDGFAWFNQGTNLVFFEKYSQAAAVYDKAREAGLPQRMLRYQFGPFFAYFNVNRVDDLLELTEYALKRSPTSEEAMLWRGWAMYRKGDKEEAVKLFQKALVARPGYTDAEYALKFVRDN
jgi:tetratricopeptide (TPR) repeat protein